MMYHEWHHRDEHVFALTSCTIFLQLSLLCYIGVCGIESSPRGSRPRLRLLVCNFCLDWTKSSNRALSVGQLHELTLLMVDAQPGCQRDRAGRFSKMSPTAHAILALSSVYPQYRTHSAKNSPTTHRCLGK